MRISRSARQPFGFQLSHGSRMVGFGKDQGEFLATEPTGGFLVWVELPDGYDGNRLCDDALERGITITLNRPGTCRHSEALNLRQRRRHEQQALPGRIQD